MQPNISKPNLDNSYLSTESSLLRVGHLEIGEGIVCPEKVAEDSVCVSVESESVGPSAVELGKSVF